MLKHLALAAMIVSLPIAASADIKSGPLDQCERTTNLDVCLDAADYYREQMKQAEANGDVNGICDGGFKDAAVFVRMGNMGHKAEFAIARGMLKDEITDCPAPYNNLAKFALAVMGK
jgi:hypothetical protein